MAVYQKLLLSAGGGIVFSAQQADQTPNTVTILIGLGGTGIDCLRTIKTQVYARLKPDYPEAPVASYSHIRFIGIDTAEMAVSNDSQEPDGLLALAPSETFSISDLHVQMALKDWQTLRQRPEMAWFSGESIPVFLNVDSDINQTRHMSHYMMMYKSQQFLARIQSEIIGARMGLLNPEVNIHICSGLSGGTGAGCFLDVCYMVRRIARQMGVTNVFGYFFLPDVSLSKIPVTDVTARRFISLNGYTSLKQLDYCMQIPGNGGRFVQRYPNQEIDWKEPPVDMCHLICAADSNGNFINDAYNYAMNVTAEYIMDFLTRSVNGTFTLSEHYARFKHKVALAERDKTRDWNLNYCAIGASCVSLPLREINTYLASELFDSFSRSQDVIPTKAQIEAFLCSALAKGTTAIGDLYDNIFQNLMQDVGTEYEQYNGDCGEVMQFGDSVLVRYYQDQSAWKRNRMDINRDSLQDQNDEYSLFGRVKSALNEALKDIYRGPVYVYCMLSAAQNSNIPHLIRGLIEENRLRWNYEATQTETYNNEYRLAQTIFLGFRRPNRRAQHAFFDYERSVVNLETHKLLLDAYSMMDKLLEAFKAQVEKASIEYYKKLSNTMENLLQTFKLNREEQRAKETQTQKNTFILPLVTVKELKPSLDAIIRKTDSMSMFSTFVELLLDRENEAAWLNEEENQIVQLVTEFFSQTALNDLAGRTITKFLEDKYNTRDKALLADRIFLTCISPLTTRASPLFYYNNGIRLPSHSSNMAFISVSQTYAPIKAAAMQMQQTDMQWRVKESALTDRIYVMCNVCALPLSAYRNWDEYEREYSSMMNDDSQH